MLLLAGCGGAGAALAPTPPAAAERGEAAETERDSDAAPEPTEPAVADADAATAGDATTAREDAGDDEPPAAADPADPHPLLAGYARVLRDFLTLREARALDAIDLHGTGAADTSQLSELLRETLFRELGTRAIAALPHRELSRYGRDIRSGDADVASAHMNVESYWNALSDLSSKCADELAARPDATERCSVRYERARAAGTVASYAYDPLDVSTMAFEDPGVPLGDGLVRRAPPKPLVDLLRDAETAGLPRTLIRRIAIDLLRRLVREARP